MSHILSLFDVSQITTTLRVLFLIIIGFFVARIFSVNISRVFRSKLTRLQTVLLRRFLYYIILALFLTSAIQQLGFDITPLLGATGLLTVGLGIASQTSMSNVISGVFIIGEKPFEVGDTIKVNNIEGEVISIDFLSAKIRTGENVMVRIPNEILMKTPITNMSFYPKRCVDLIFNVSYKEELSKVKENLLAIADKNEFALKDPKPAFVILGFNDFAISIKLSLWAAQANVQTLKNTIQEQVKHAFAQAGIEIPYSSLHAGNAALPWPVKFNN